MTAMLPARSHMAAPRWEVARLERRLRRKTFEIEVLEEALAAARAKIEVGSAPAGAPGLDPDRPARS